MPSSSALPTAAELRAMSPAEREDLRAALLAALAALDALDAGLDPAARLVTRPRDLPGLIRRARRP